MTTKSPSHFLTKQGALSVPAFATWFPYCFEPLTEEVSGVTAWLPLNRDYKPLGVTTDAWVKYEDHVESAIVFSRDPRRFEDVWSSSPRKDTLYLYNDDPQSRANYFERLSKLLSHKHEMFAFEAGGRRRREPIGGRRVVAGARPLAVGSFWEWLKQAKVTHDPAGDFIGDMRADRKAWGRDFSDIEQLRSYLRSRGACEGAIDAIPTVWGRYLQWREKAAPQPGVASAL